MMPARPLALQFKGSRDYLHGTDFYEAIVGTAAAEKGLADAAVKLSIHHLSRRQVALHWQDGKAARPSDAAVVFRLAAPGAAPVEGWLSETETPVEGRYPYNEDEAVSPARVEGETIKFAQKTAYKPIEILVAMTKRLHYTVMPTSAGKWMFTRLELDRRLQSRDTDALTVRLTNRLGQRLTKSEVQVSGRRIGDIYFSVVQA